MPDSEIEALQCVARSGLAVEPWPYLEGEQAEVVDPSAGKADGAGEGACCDRHAGGYGKGGVAGSRGGADGTGRDRSRGGDAASASGCRGCAGAGSSGLGRRLLLGRKLLLLAELFRLRAGDEELPEEEDTDRQDDREKEVAVIGHQSVPFAGFFRRDSASKPPIRSVTRRSN